jgi:hypothetical protein
VHKKTGGLYEVMRYDALNCTNAQADQKVVVYRKYCDNSILFVREVQEFFEKFQKY